MSVVHYAVCNNLQALVVSYGAYKTYLHSGPEEAIEGGTMQTNEAGYGGGGRGWLAV